VSAATENVQEEKIFLGRVGTYVKIAIIKTPADVLVGDLIIIHLLMKTTTMSRSTLRERETEKQVKRRQQPHRVD
jgi:hypothetical protein